MTTIHQFSPVVTHGDGVSGSAFYIRSLLRKLGYNSDIFAWKSADELAGDVHSLSRFNSKHCDLLLVHHSMGHEQGDWLHSIECPKLLVYHNITPSEFFSPESGEHFYSRLGREQLKEWKPLFRGAISASPYNCRDLEEAGYDNIAVIPLLVDLDKFEGSVLPPGGSWSVPKDDRLIISVGRIVENKRQHLLLEALWHLKKMLPDHPLRLVLAGGTTSPGYHHQVLARIEEIGLEESVTLAGKCPDGELRWLYRNASLMWCASAHEGFCMPLVEANYFSLPVISVASSNIPDTLGQSGLLLEHADPVAMAATTAKVLEDNGLAKSLAKAGRDNLQRYTADTLIAGLQQYLARLGFNP